MKANKFVKTIISFGISSLLVVYIYLNRHQLLDIFKHIDIAFVLVVLLGEIGIQIANALTLKANMAPIKKDLGFSEIFKLTTVSSFVNFFTPVVGGASLKALYFKNRHKIPFATFVSVIYGNYLIFFLTSFTIGIVGMLLKPSTFHQHVGQIVAVFFVGGILGSLAFILGGHFIVRLIGKMPSDARWFNGLKNKLQVMEEGWLVIRRSKKSMLLMGLWSTVATLCGGLAYWAAMRSLHIHPTLSTVFIYASLGVVGLLFNVTPGSIGVREAVYAAIFSITSITPRQVVAFALVDRPVQLLVISLGWILFSRGLLGATGVQPKVKE